MRMRNEIKTEIKRLCAKAFSRERVAQETEEKYREKFERRTGTPAGSPTRHVEASLHRHFDARHCKRHANAIATALWQKILDFKYDPEPAVFFEIPKLDGTLRGITAFCIPDAAVANVLLRRTLERNRKRFSPHSFAYHPDRNVFDAILALQDFESVEKNFVIQIDFKKYFDNIPSRYLKQQISDHRIASLTPHERHIFKSFMHHRFANRTDYSNNDFKRKMKGTPQGSSASLFLANIANHDLDRELAKQSGRFVRYADDVVALCSDYAGAQKIETCFSQHCKNSGLLINKKKSPGISILSENDQEIRTSQDFTYLGYSFREQGLTIPNSSAKKFKVKISRLINIYLINSLKYGYNYDRASRHRRYDWDLLGLIYEMRRSFYGGLKEDEIQAFLYQGQSLRKMRGLMGFYCLLDDPEPLKQIDGWALSMVRRSCVHRDNFLQSHYRRRCPTPSKLALLDGSWMAASAWRDREDLGEETIEVAFPSLTRGWRAARKHFFTYGLERVQPPDYRSYSDISSLFDAFEYLGH